MFARSEASACAAAWWLRATLVPRRCVDQRFAPLHHRDSPGGLAPLWPGRGQLRNAQMIALGADGCAAFLRGASPGNAATLQVARAAGIPVWLHTQPQPAPVREVNRRQAEGDQREERF